MFEPTHAFDEAECIHIVLQAQHGWGVDGAALEQLSHKLAVVGQAEQLRQRPRRCVAFKPIDGPRRQDQHAVLRLATQHLLPRECRHIELPPINVLREHRGGRVADCEPLAIGCDPIAVRHAHARSGAVPREHHVAIELHFGEVRQVAIGRQQRANVGELELLDNVSDPIAAERFPSEHVHAFGAE